MLISSSIEGFFASSNRGMPILERIYWDLFESLRCDCGEQLHKSLEMIENEGNGILVYLRQEGRGWTGSYESCWMYKNEITLDSTSIRK